MSVPIRWISEHPAAQPTNQVAVQRVPSDEIVLTFGCIDTPIISGTAKAQREQVASIAEHGLEVRSVARLVLSMKTAREFHQALTNELDEKGE